MENSDLLAMVRSKAQGWLSESYDAETRAEVKRELQEAYEKGLMSVSDSDYPILPQEKSTKTREQIKQELEQSKRSGESKRIDRELYRG